MTDLASRLRYGREDSGRQLTKGEWEALKACLTRLRGVPFLPAISKKVIPMYAANEFMAMEGAVGNEPFWALFELPGTGLGALAEEERPAIVQFLYADKEFFGMDRDLPTLSSVISEGMVKRRKLMWQQSLALSGFIGFVVWALSHVLMVQYAIAAGNPAHIIVMDLYALGIGIAVGVFPLSVLWWFNIRPYTFANLQDARNKALLT